MSEPIEVQAQWQSQSTQSSGPGESRGWVKFLVYVHAAASLMEDDVLGERAFTVTFDDTLIGVGLTASTISAKRDPEGGTPASGLTFAVPTTAVAALAKAIGKGLVGKTGKLVLTPDQLSFDLTAKAE